jgi:hypothetical protein
MLARTKQDGPQHALHVIDYHCAMTLATLRVLGVCNRSAGRKLTDDEFDHSQFSEENGDGPIY